MKFKVLVAPMKDLSASYEDEVCAASPQDLNVMYGMIGMKLLKILGAAPDMFQGEDASKPLPPPNAPNPTLKTIDAEGNALPPEEQKKNLMAKDAPSVNGNIQTQSAPVPMPAPVKEQIFTDGDNIYKINNDGVYKKDWDILDPSTYRLMKLRKDGTMVEFAMNNDKIIVQTKQWKKIETKKD